MKTCKCGFTTNAASYKFCPRCANILQERCESERAQIYNAHDIARYAVNYINMHGECVSNLKLQKILYYVQAAFLVEKNKPCFYQDIVNWQHGPVVPGVYHSFAKYGDSPILYIGSVSTLEYKDGRFAFRDHALTAYKISQEDILLINKVLDGLMCYDAWFLAARTMEEEPWVELGTNYNSIILPIRIRDYFIQGRNKERIIWQF